MADLNGFDANKVEPTTFEALPAGRYLAAITDSEMKPTKNGDGRYLQLAFTVLEGAYKRTGAWFIPYEAGQEWLEERKKAATPSEEATAS